jgi:hypothetical protein
VTTGYDLPALPSPSELDELEQLAATDAALTDERARRLRELANLLHGDLVALKRRVADPDGLQLTDGTYDLPPLPDGELLDEFAALAGFVAEAATGHVRATPLPAERRSLATVTSRLVAVAREWADVL